ncbi:MAG: tryptophan halogenase family protein [Alcanivoracaceae bacterium]
MSPIRRIVVLGGGTSGWMAAAYIRKTIESRMQEASVICVESPEVATVGVGEATVPNLRDTLEYIGIGENDFLARTNGSFKQAIRFERWVQPDQAADYYFHPFDYGAQQSFPALVRHWMVENPDAPAMAFARDTCVQSVLCERMRSPFREGDYEFHGSAHYAYHTDATLLATVLREHAVARGVEHISARMVSAKRSANGDIEALVLDDGREVHGDLFIDCSGFRSLLLEQTMGARHKPFAPHLLCDRAVATRLPAVENRPLVPYTRAIAHQNGWMWRIPLFTREGCGHVYSSAHQSPEQAEQALRAATGAGDDTPVWHLAMRTGCHDSYWIGNCVGIGLAAGFIEPLESTGIYITEIGLRLLADNLPRTLAEAAPLKREFNRAMQDLFDELVNFITFHYAIAGRRDTPFWEDAAQPARWPDRLAHLMELWQHRPPGPRDAGLHGAQFNYLSYVFVLAGMRPAFSRRYRHDGEMTHERYLKILSKVKELQEKELAGLPDHRAWLEGLRRTMADRPVGAAGR